MKPHEDPSAHLALAKTLLPPTAEGEPVFQAPWQARIFALMVSIVNDKFVPWKSFQSRLVAEIDSCKTQARSETASAVELNYYSSWLAAAERTLIEEGFIIDSDIERQMNEIRAAVEQVRHNQTTHINLP